MLAASESNAEYIGHCSPEMGSHRTARSAMKTGFMESGTGCVGCGFKGESKSGPRPDPHQAKPRILGLLGDPRDSQSGLDAVRWWSVKATCPPSTAR